MMKFEGNSENGASGLTGQKQETTDLVMLLSSHRAHHLSISLFRSLPVGNATLQYILALPLTFPRSPPSFANPFTYQCRPRRPPHPTRTSSSTPPTRQAGTSETCFPSQSRLLKTNYTSPLPWNDEGGSRREKSTLSSTLSTRRLRWTLR